MSRERRKHFRVNCNAPATIYDMDGRSSWPCSLTDFSNGGGKISGVLALTIPEEFMLRISQGRTRQCRVRWRMAFTLGVEFMDRPAAVDDPSERKVLEPAQ